MQKKESPANGREYNMNVREDDRAGVSARDNLSVDSFTVPFRAYALLLSSLLSPLHSSSLHFFFLLFTSLLVLRFIE